MNQSRHPLHVFIFNDASVAGLLRADSPLWADFVPGLVVELSEHPALAHSLDLETPPAYPGLAGLLGPATAPADLVVRLPSLPFPAILASSHPLTSATVTAAFRKLACDSRVHGPRVILVDAALMQAYAPALASCTKIGIAWDLSVAPAATLSALLGTLSTENLLRPDNWAGLHAYFSPDHQATDEERAAAMAALSALLFDPGLIPLRDQNRNRYPSRSLLHRSRGGDCCRSRTRVASARAVRVKSTWRCLVYRALCPSACRRRA
jgi:hypothetical protein